MRTPKNEEKTREQVEAIVANGHGLTIWEREFIERQVKWIKAALAPWWSDDQAAKIEQIWKGRVK